MNIRLDPAHLSARADAIEARAAELAARRTAIEGSVDALLAGWRGEAAARFGELWREWRDGADGVIDHLITSAVCLRHAGAEMTVADSDAARSHDRIRGRLG